MLYFFFDIDGTLLLSGGAGRVAMTQVMQEMFGITDLNRIEVHGRTDLGIIQDLFSAHDCILDERVHCEFTERYHKLLPDCMMQCQGFLMPGVRQLLDHLFIQDHVKLGILTGNSSRAAQIKLEHFGLDHYFDFGGYGGDHDARDLVAADALAACCEFHGESNVESRKVWVVGDTIHDISCARSIDANVVAVATGGGEMELLQQHGPDVLLADLSDTHGFLEVIHDSVSE